MFMNVIRTRKALVVCGLCVVFSFVLDEPLLGDVGRYPTSDDDEPTEPYLDQTTKHVVRGRIYAFFNHNSETWDPEKVTSKATRRLTEIADENDVPIISTVEGFADDKPVDSHFLREKEITIPVRSSNGEHRLLFPNPESVTRLTAA